MQAAVGESNVDLKTLFVVLDQPYTSAAAIGENLEGSIGKGFMAAGVPVGLDVELPGDLWTKTDGLDNLKKAAKLKDKDIPLLCFQTECDSLMGRKKIDGKYTENFAQDLLAARYDNDVERIENLVINPGGHGLNCLNLLNACENINEKLPSQNNR